MRYYFIEILACPHCKHFPLEHYTIEEVEDPVETPVDKLRCKNWCGLYSRKAEEVPIDRCRECVNREMVTGLLICNNCGRWYPVLDKIPRLIDDKYRREKEDKEFLSKYLSQIPEHVRNKMVYPPVTR
ncbi:MAG: Trm112 family protein [Desulfurococcales archaeon]|nr:Trm112 family protein [Desulfurococcales archaeon]